MWVITKGSLFSQALVVFLGDWTRLQITDGDGLVT